MTTNKEAELVYSEI